MNKMYKAIATASILAMSLSPIAAFAQPQDVPPAPIHAGQGNIQNQAIVKPATVGLITNFTNDKSGKFVTVTGHGLAAVDQSEIVLAITKETRIIDSKGRTVPLKKVIDEQRAVKAFYGPNITRSLPARGTALTLVVQDYTFTAITGKVTEVNGTSLTVQGTNLYSGLEDTIILHIAPKAQLLNENGQAIQASDIQVGMTVKSFYGPAVTMSLPPQSTTNYVVVTMSEEETAPQEAPGTDGIITNAVDGKITVIGNALPQGGVNYVILSIDKETQIVDENGTTLAADALKADTRVVATYGPAMTMIYPAQTHADKIVVKKAEAPKIIGTIEAGGPANADQVYVNVGSDNDKNNDVVLNISDKTTIIPALSGDAELKPGMRIIAYHSMAMTASLPPQTSAEVIIVTE
ncbi:peptidase [Paenibacillus sp. MMS18-CY102]|uniref:peptidase n=1 Tax=Paenibacillus sp. MMS18-CY102 TaxID=2682849 RepID=UPI00136658E3|nr:peptidase [Paenibacillus sp. MMS18-CY102]MWC29709.1 peptidase [Paenibacillus sp. MMS18-CY102]